MQSSTTHLFHGVSGAKERLLQSCGHRRDHEGRRQRARVGLRERDLELSGAAPAVPLVVEDACSKQAGTQVSDRARAPSMALLNV